MCTLSVITSGSERIITMNRDECRDRDEMGLLHTTQEYAFPIDKKSQGTWIGINCRGIVLAILNRYQDHHNSASLQTKSRGRIIPYLLQKSSVAEMRKTIQDMELKLYIPFDCVMITYEDVVRVSWNGENLIATDYNIRNDFFMTSSSENFEEVSKYRQKKFQKFFTSCHDNHVSPQKIMDDLHAKQIGQDDAYAIYMSRNKTHTKSITQILLKKNETQLSYNPAPDFPTGQDKKILHFDLPHVQ